MAPTFADSSSQRDRSAKAGFCVGGGGLEMDWKQHVHLMCCLASDRQGQQRISQLIANILAKNIISGSIPNISYIT